MRPQILHLLVCNLLPAELGDTRKVTAALLKQAESVSGVRKRDGRSTSTRSQQMQSDKASA